MPSSWNIYRLGDLANIGSSKRIKMADYVSKGIPFYRSKEIIEKNKGNVISTELFISEKQFSAIEEKFGAPKELDILLTSVGTLGVPYQVQKGERFYFKDGNLTWLRDFRDFVNPKYIYFWLTSSVARRKIDEVTIGSTQQALTIVALKSLTIDLPPLEIQNIIVQYLEALDSKIAVNRQTNQILEQMAQALFKSWFVDFDPVVDNVLAAGNPIPDELAHRVEVRKKAHALPDFQPLPEHTRSLFPSEFEQTGEPTEGIDGWVPKGWSIKLTGSLIDVRDGTHDSPPKSESGFPLVTSRHISSGTLNLKDAYLISKKDFDKVNLRSNVEQRDILLTMIGTTGIPYFVLQEDVKFAIKNVGLFRTSQVPEYGNYLFQLLKSQRMQAYLDAHTAGTTQKYLSLKVLRSIPLLIPEEKTLVAFNEIIDKQNRKTISNLQANDSLTKIRDSLLPNLIAGKIKLDLTGRGSDSQ